MNLKRQLLLVSLLTLLLPWAGCEFIRETESALRAGQQHMLAGTARAIADSLSNYPEKFPAASTPDYLIGEQLYAHQLEVAPGIDGYFDDWPLSRAALRELRGSDGPIRFAIGFYETVLFVYVEVSDDQVVYAGPGIITDTIGARHADRVGLVSSNPPYREETFVFSAEAPGSIVARLQTAYGSAPEPRVLAHWQDGPRGYQLEARIPAGLLGTHIGFYVENTADSQTAVVRSASYAARHPGPLVTRSAELTRIASGLVQPAMRLIITDPSGWRLATAGDLRIAAPADTGLGSTWLRIIYEALVEGGEDAELAEPSPTGREQQRYIGRALEGGNSVSWYRSAENGRAVVAVAESVISGGEVIGAVILQQGTDATLSLRSAGLARLINLSLIAALLVAAALLGYASFLSRRIRRLSLAAEAALETDDIRRSLPSAHARDEVGDLSRSFANVLGQLADYNEYLRTLASKLSHELRTPLAIVTSSLENLEQEPLDSKSKGYAERAKDGADRLRRILTAMSEASRVEELMTQVEPVNFDLLDLLRSTLSAYGDAYKQRIFELRSNLAQAPVSGSPELIIQLLDKLIDNAVDFSAEGDRISVGLELLDDELHLSVANPGASLPARMQSQVFDPMVSVRSDDGEHLGLGLSIARIIAEGHGGSIRAADMPGGVVFTVVLPHREGGALESADGPNAA